MDQQNIEQQFRDIHHKHAWASEETLKEMVSHSSSEIGILKKAMQKLMGKDYDADKIDEALNAVRKGDKQSFDLNQKAIKTVDNIFAVTSRDVSPLEATAELMEMSAKGLDSVLDAAGNAAKKIPVLGDAAATAMSAAGAATVAATGVVAIYARIITEQEKAVRQLIDAGAIANNIAEYTKMRRSVANLGMSMQELNALMGQSTPMLANMQGDLLDATKTFVNFAAGVEYQTSKSMGDFGYSTDQLASRLMEEADLMFHMGELTKLDQNSKEKIRKNFERSTAMTTFLAEKFGDQRNSLLAMRQEALTNVDFMTAMNQNAEFIANEFGENAAENIKNVGGSLNMMMTNLLGPAFGDETQAIFNNFLKDINYDPSVLNNMPADMIQKLNMMGPEVLQQYQKIIEQGGTGQLTENELVMEIQELTRLISGAKPRLGDDPLIQESNELIAMARTAPKAFLEISKEQLEAGVKTVAAAAENADGVIDAIDKAKIAFRNMVDMLTPGYETSAQVMAWFSRALEFTVDTMKSFVAGLKAGAAYIGEVSDMLAKVSIAPKGITDGEFNQFKKDLMDGTGTFSEENKQQFYDTVEQQSTDYQENKGQYWEDYYKKKKEAESAAKSAGFESARDRRHAEYEAIKQERIEAERELQEQLAREEEETYGKIVEDGPQPVPELRPDMTKDELINYLSRRLANDIQAVEASSLIKDKNNSITELQDQYMDSLKHIQAGTYFQKQMQAIAELDNKINSAAQSVNDAVGGIATSEIVNGN